MLRPAIRKRDFAPHGWRTGDSVRRLLSAASMATLAASMVSQWLPWAASTHRSPGDCSRELDSGSLLTVALGTVTKTTPHSDFTLFRDPRLPRTFLVEIQHFVTRVHTWQICRNIPNVEHAALWS